MLSLCKNPMAIDWRVLFGYIESMERNEQLQLAVEELNESRPVDTIGCKQFAWGAMRGNWLSGALVLLVSHLLGLALQTPLFFLNEDSGLYWAWAWISTLLEGIVWFGFTVNFLLFARGADHSLKHLFVGFTKMGFFLRILGTELLQGIFVFLWSLLLLVPGIVKIYSYTMTEFVLLDHPEYSPLQSITASKKMMYGHRLELMMLQLRFLGWFLLCVLSLGIAAFWVAPYYMTAKSRFYMDLLAREAN